MSEKETTIISGRDAWYSPKKRDLFILKQLVDKDFKLKYRRSILGVAWSVLNPLLMMCIMSLVFSTFLGARDSSVGNYPLYLILGNTAFQLMADATGAGLRSIIDASSLLKKVRINRLVFPVQKVAFALVNYVFSLIAIAIVMIFFQIVPTWHILLLPVGLLMLALFCVGISLMLSAGAVFFRDIIHLWGVVLTAWTYATPLFYSINILPPMMVTIEQLNPMYHYVTFIRKVVLWHQMPSMITWLGCILSAVFALIIGYLIFRRHEHKFILYI